MVAEIGSINYWIANRSLPVRYFKLRRSVMEPILRGETYPAVAFIDDVHSIVDIGASVGLASLWFANRYPDARIVAFEPQQESFVLLQENTASIPAITPVNLGLFDRAVTVPLYQGLSAGSTGSIGRSRLNAKDSEEVTLAPAADELRAQGVSAIDILKVDTEGCEVAILRALLPNFSPRVIYLEYHSDADRREIDGLLTDYVLLRASAGDVHVGELCYVAREAFPPGYLERRRIVLPSTLAPEPE